MANDQTETDRVVPPATKAASDDPRFDLKELVRVLKRRRAWVLWIAAVPVLAALIYGVVAPPLYTASTQILIDPRDRRILTNEVNPETLAADGGIAVVESQLLVLTSDNVLRRVIASQHLDTDPEFGGQSTGVFTVLLRGLGNIGSSNEQPDLKALRLMKRGIGVKRSERAFVVDVFVTTEDREKSVRIANGIAQAYLDDQAAARASATQQASSALVARLESLRDRVRQAAERVEQFKNEHKILAAGGVLVNEQQLSEINIELKNARTRTSDARSRYEQIENARKAGAEAGAIPEAVQSQTIGQMRVQYAEAIRQRADVGSQLGPRHPGVATLNAQVRELNRLINEELARIVAAAKNELERAEASEQALERAMEQLRDEAISTNESLVVLRELERELEASRTVYQAFLARARETGEQQSIDSSNARVISTATVPRDKSWPPRMLLLTIALVGGLGIGAGAGLMREYLDEAVHTREQLEQLTGVPVLGVLPEFNGSAGRPNRMDLKPPPDPATTTPATTPAAEPEAGHAAIARLFEAISNDAQSSRGRTILISSAREYEGKTTLALHLAIEAARNGERTLLVDADFDKRALSQLLDANDNAGLADVLEGRSSLASLPLRDEKTGVHFLPAGKATALRSRRPKIEDIAANLMRPAREFDLVIIDTGSVLQHNYVRPFAESADGVLMVVRAGITSKEDIVKAVEIMSTQGRKVLGTVLNQATEDLA